MTVDIPEQVGDKIAVNGLAAATFYVDGKVTNLPSYKFDKPMFDDFKIIDKGGNKLL